MELKVGFVILNYCTWEETLKCAERIWALAHRYTPIICVVDNNSPVKITTIQKEQLQRMVETIIFNEENNGYNAGNNIGLKYLLRMNCDYYVIVNSDVLIEEGAIDKMIATAEKDDEIGIVGPTVIERGQKKFYGCNRRKALGDIYLTSTVLSKFAKKRVEKLHNYLMYGQRKNNFYKVYTVSGCCFLMTKFCCKKMYPLDDTMKLYNEENLLGVRMEQANLSTVVCEEAIIFHEHGVSTRKDPAHAYIEKVRSDFYYIMEYLQEPGLLVYPLYLIRYVSFWLNERADKDFNPNNRLFPKYKECIKLKNRGRVC